ncbi:RRP15-like protein [Drosophila kikkawai]|uniref:RRP15-like protein n=1 Tax=Drosophila kikkawai TaxID=30033 RepID=A0A6P4I625_DROKI|nr:RRP15-like protein [Drosophila kikkawai]
MALLTQKRARKTPAPATDSSADESDSEGSQNAGSDVEAGGGWADSILNVLKTTKPEAKDETVLTRAKKGQAAVGVQKSRGSTKQFDFEIDKTTAKKGQEEDNDDDDDDVKPEASALDAQLTKQQRKNVPLQLRVKPSYQDMARERTLRKVATRGTVQFFNAVRIQQKNLQHELEEAGPLDSRQDAVLNNINKRKFLDVLMSGKRSKSTAIDNSVKKEEQETDDDEEEEDGSSAPIKKKSEWSVLREDFMTNKKIKHWDEDDDDGSDQDGNDDGADDSDDDGED